MIAALIVLPFVSACKRSSSGGRQYNEAIPVNVAKVQKEKVAFYDEYPGTVVALNEVELRSEVSGLITGIFFKEGDYVKKGQKLYEIDRSQYLASYDQAKANVDIANANVARAQRYVDRYTMLNKKEAIAKQQLDDAETNLENAKLQLVSAKAGLVKAQTDLNYSVINAPFGGTIGLSQVKMGALITPGQTLLNTISSDDPIGVEFVINENELGRFQKLWNRKVPANDSTFRITLPDNALYPKDGKIDVIDRAVDPQTATIKIRLVFPNHHRRLRDGMSCDVHVLNPVAGEQLVIPYKAVLEQMSEYFVFVVDSTRVHQVKITLGPQMNGLTVVTHGLQEGQQIVTDGVQKLHDGSEIIVGHSGTPEGKK